MTTTSPAPQSLSVVPALGPERPVVFPARVHRKLDNGLEIVLVESHTLAKFTGELYFRDTVYQMFDFDGSGHDDVITHGGGGIRVYACKTAKPSPKRVVKDPNVLRWKVANQTEYK